MLYVAAFDDGSGRTTTKEFEAKGEAGRRNAARALEEEAEKYSTLTRYTMSVIYEEGREKQNKDEAKEV